MSVGPVLRSVLGGALGTAIGEGVGGYPGRSYAADFASDRYWSEGISVPAATAYSFLRASLSLAAKLDGSYLTFANDNLARTDVGAQIEPSRVNSIRNDTFAGSTVGVIGSGGVLPTNMARQAGTGIAIAVVGTGTENGLEYMDVRWSGTAGASVNPALFFEPQAASGVAASFGQSWGMSLFCKLVAGSLANITGGTLSVAWNEYNAGSTYLSTKVAQAIAPGAAMARYGSAGAIVSGTTAFMTPMLLWSAANGAVIDFTVRIYRPRLELGATVTSPGTGTRAVDALTINLPSGTHDLDVIFDDDSVFKTANKVTSYAVPTTLARPRIKRIEAYAPPIHDTFARADGAPGTADSGQAWQFPTIEAGVVAPVISGNKLVASADLSPGTTACYSGLALDAPAKEMRAKISFAAGAAFGSAVLIANPHGLSSVQNIRDDSLHIVFGDTRVDFGVFVGGVYSTSAGNVNYGAALAHDGTVYEIGWSISGDTVTVRLPDGTTTSKTDPRFSACNGKYCTFETFFGAGLCQAQFSYASAR